MLLGYFVTTVIVGAVAALSDTMVIKPVVILPSASELSKIKNLNIIRQVDLSSFLTKETTSIIFENSGPSKISEYYWGVEESDSIPRLSHLQVKDKNTNTDLLVEQVGWDFENQIRYHKITLFKPLSPGDSATITIDATYTGMVEPRPKNVAQTETQYFVWKGNKYSWSLYETAKQKTKLKTPTANIKTFTMDNELSTKSINVLTYGNYDSIQPKSRDIVEIQYEFQAPALAVKSYHRDVEISHWGGNLAVEDHIWLTNVGAELKGQFSRLQHQQSMYSKAPTHYLRDMTLGLPYDARDVYYRDEIGNVSTSSFRKEPIRGRSVLELRPRYPILGGWEYNFNVGYNLPLGNYLRYDSKTNKYIFQFNFISPLVDIAFQDVFVRLVLPEGAEDIDLASPYTLASSDIKTFKTYADTNLGRPVLEMHLGNLVDKHAFGVFYVTYSYPLGIQGHLRKPLAIAGATFSIFLGFILLSRLETRIGK